jgi:hypothetical protein
LYGRVTVFVKLVPDFPRKFLRGAATFLQNRDFQKTLILIPLAGSTLHDFDQERCVRHLRKPLF